MTISKIKNVDLCSVKILYLYFVTFIQIDSESAKNVGANLERITADLKQMKQETAALTAQLQSKAS